MLLILLSGDVSGLISLFKETGSMIVGVGFVCAGLSIVKKAISNPEKMYSAIISYLVALVIFLSIWSLI